jgi:trehalose 6-phosphate synthase
MAERLVVASNRVPPPQPPAEAWLAGGLVSALLPALEARGNAVWLGWSGETGDPYAAPRRTEARGVRYVTLDLAPEQVRAYYEGFCNAVLWPVLHGLPERASEAAADGFADYRAVNRRFAGALLELLEPDDLLWVHDYHLIPLASELRRLGWRGRAGYFHHTPVPTPEHWALLPQGPGLAAAFGAYDLLGVQTERDAERLRQIGGTAVGGRVRAYPISIDPDRLRSHVDGRRRPRLLETGDRRRLFFGVDRLDYTKAIPSASRPSSAPCATTRPCARRPSWCSGRRPPERGCPSTARSAARWNWRRGARTRACPAGRYDWNWTRGPRRPSPLPSTAPTSAW